MIEACLAMLDAPEDKALLREAYERYDGLMRGLAGAILGSEDLAEEAAQDAWMKTALHFDRFAAVPPEKRRAWLVMVAENAAKDILRREKHYAPLEEWEAPQADPGETAEDYLADCIAALPERYRLVLERKYVLGWTDGEMAKTLGLSRSGVSMQLTRARELLREKLREEGYYDDEERV